MWAIPRRITINGVVFFLHGFPRRVREKLGTVSQVNFRQPKTHRVWPVGANAEKRGASETDVLRGNKREQDYARETLERNPREGRRVEVEWLTCTRCRCFEDAGRMKRG